MTLALRSIVSACALSAGVLLVALLPSSAPPALADVPLTVSAVVMPNPVSYGAYPVLTVRSRPGALCAATVVYDTGRRANSFGVRHSWLGSSGVVRWRWHMESRGRLGAALVICAYGSTRNEARAMARFGILPSR
jgi:hypothetical protein